VQKFSCATGAGKTKATKHISRVAFETDQVFWLQNYLWSTYATTYEVEAKVVSLAGSLLIMRQWGLSTHIAYA
jgi:hypothetical protein